MQTMWINLGIEEFSFFDLAKFIIPKCEFPVLPSYENQYMSEELKYKSRNPRFHCFTRKEEEALLNGTWIADDCSVNDKLPFGFYFPDCTISEANRWLGGSLEFVDNKISEHFYEGNCLIFCKQMLYRAVFVILHEYGHYLTYKRLGASREKFARYAIETKKEFFSFRKKLSEMNSISEDDKKKDDMLYRMSGIEKEADDYALAELEKTVDKVIEYLNGPLSRFSAN